MKSNAVFTGVSEETEISKKTAPEFYQLYQQSILLSLKEQGILNEVQYQLCMNTLIF